MLDTVERKRPPAGRAAELRAITREGLDAELKTMDELSRRATALNFMLVRALATCQNPADLEEFRLYAESLRETVDRTMDDLGVCARTVADLAIDTTKVR